MLKLPSISQKLLNEYSTPKVLSSGTQYYQQGSVRNVVASTQVVHAQVRGSETYDVQIGFTNYQVDYADCTCPYGDNYSGWCKHIIAALLYLDNHAEQLQAEYLALKQFKDLSKDQLISLVEYLNGQDAKNTAAVQRFLKSLTQATQHTDLLEFQRGLDQIFKHTPNSRAIAAIGQKISQSIEALQTDQALSMLDMVFSQYSQFFSDPDDDEDEDDWDDDYYYFHDYHDDDRIDEIHQQIEDLSTLLVQALLDSELEDEHVEQWRDAIKTWLSEVEYVFEPLEYALAVLDEPWDSGLLSEAMQAHISSEQFVQANYRVPFAQRIMSLYRRGLLSEGDNLAKSCNLFEYMVINRIKRGLIDEAFQLAKKHFDHANQIASLGQSLKQQGNPQAMLRFGELGTHLQGPYEQLDTWLNPIASNLKRYDLVLFLNQHLLLQSPDPIRFVQTKKIANARWPQLREQLLKHYQSLAGSNNLIEILLEEGEIELAIQKINPMLFEDTIVSVMRAASTTHPVWIKQMTEQFAHNILEAGKSNNYPLVIQRLQIAKTSLNDPEWLAFAQQLFEQYRRKRSFVELIRKLEPRLAK